MAEGQQRLAESEYDFLGGWPLLAGATGPPGLGGSVFAKIPVLPGVDAHCRAEPVTAVREGAAGLEPGVARLLASPVAPELTARDRVCAFVGEAVAANRRVVAADGSSLGGGTSFFFTGSQGVHVEVTKPPQW